MDKKTDIKKTFKRSIIVLLVMIPIVFVLVFFGYFRVNFDLILHTDSVNGEGICQTYVCPTQGFAIFYQLDFYFGSELKKATIKGYHYDVNPIELKISDVSSFDITGIDSYVKGIHLGHFEPKDIIPDGEVIKGEKATLTSQKGVLHVDIKDPNVGATVFINQPFIPIWFWIAYFVGMLLIAVFLALIMIRLMVVQLIN